MKTALKMNYEFGPAHFSKWATQLIQAKHPGAYTSPVRTWPLGTQHRLDSVVRDIVDHGFVVEAAPMGGALAGMPEGHEFAVIARTYCADDMIDNPPEGLRCYRLPPETMGSDDPGTAIAVVVESVTPVALDFIGLFDNLPGYLLACALPLHLSEEFRLVLQPYDMFNSGLRVTSARVEDLQRTEDVAQ